MSKNVLPELTTDLRSLLRACGFCGIRSMNVIELSPDCFPPGILLDTLVFVSGAAETLLVRLALQVVEQAEQSQ